MTVYHKHEIRFTGHLSQSYSDTQIAAIKIVLLNRAKIIKPLNTLIPNRVAEFNSFIWNTFNSRFGYLVRGQL